MSGFTVSGQVAKVMDFTMPSVLVKVQGPPTQVSTGSLPLLFVRNAKMSNQERSLGYKEGLTPITFEICVLVEAVRQGNQDDCYAKMRLIMDEMHDALEANADAIRLDAYSIYETFESGTDSAVFYAVVGEISTS